ncbi:2-amino-3-carboxymuconate-6-semialdehyde decarboxylase [Lasiodiplodia theobromae]|uniref:2-amino-3-carboxymuconate-6-semialdehyde decarboxylase n=1 Tax=Lasiodiplodia theobromae TaxID=45133 RepID=UPI0015C30C2B|nr:2-amino-3-carboxymuconate-6-semialdehyde decarboxylase [Lasiodiplodia theobromae]KAF4543350.1 2-amino-3-carboxymuconate-6-semialdehyde decarboxylase [Lasiodiplodia theobromae]
MSEKSIILITGANSGVGFAAAAALLAESPSHHVIVAARSAERGHAAARELQSRNLPGTLSLLQLDVTSARSIASAVATVEGEFGKLDALINNAGLMSKLDSLEEQLRETFELNTFAPALVTQAFVPLLKLSTNPRLIHISSDLGSIALKSDPSFKYRMMDHMAYRMSKAALNMMTACHATQFQDWGCKVWSYCPGFVVTNAWKDGEAGREAMKKAGAGDVGDSAKGDPSGWPTPRWTRVSSELVMKRLGIQTAILSVTAPGACIIEGQASFDLARSLNEYAAEIRNKHPDKFGFFASLPSLLDTEAVLSEIRYSLDTLNADGIILFTRYGSSNTYLGHPSLEPIWTELNRRKSVVFIHPTHPADTTKVNPRMPQPMIDYPHETTRTAMDMIMNGTREKFPDCKVILSHAGGTLPYVVSRIATPLKAAPSLLANELTGVTYEKIMKAFRSFHYDLALSASPAVMNMLLELVPHDHILYGSDFPYAPPPAYPSFLQELEGFEMDWELRDRINYGNAHKLFPRLGLATLY